MEACEREGLVTTDGLCPRVVLLQGGTLVPMPDEAQLVLLAVVQGINVLTARGAETLENAPAECVATTCLGTIEVHSSPAAPPWPTQAPHLIDADFGAGLGQALDVTTNEEVVSLVLKLRKRDAMRVARQVEHVDRLRIEMDGGDPIVYALEGEVELGVLVHLDGEALDVKALLGANRMLLCVSAGGPRRPRIQPKDFVLQRAVEVLWG